MFAKQLKIMNIRLLMIAFVFMSLFGCGGGGGGGTSSGSSSVADSGAAVSGIAVDPYITGAVFVEIPAGGGSPLQESTPSEEDGYFSFSNALTVGSTLQMKAGARGKHNNIPFTGILKGVVSEDGPIVVSPLTTLLANGMSAEEVVALLDEAGLAGLTEEDVTADPMAELVGLEDITPEDLVNLQAAMGVNAFLSLMGNYDMTFDQVVANHDRLAEMVALVKETLNEEAFDSFFMDFENNMGVMTRGAFSGRAMILDPAICASVNITETVVASAKKDASLDPVSEAASLMANYSDLALMYYVQQNRGQQSIEEAIAAGQLPNVSEDEVPVIGSDGEILPTTPPVDEPVDTPPVERPVDTAPDSTPRSELSLRIDPEFSADQLPSEVRIWYDRLWAGIRNPKQYPNAAELAQSNDTYNYGRHLNTHITSLLQVLRVTGDPALLDEIDRLAQMMREQLQDRSILTYGGTRYESDGYLNWQWLYASDPKYVGTDIHEMDDMMAHSLVAAFAYAFDVNKDLDSRYAERANFWTDYLKNHFEAKWRDRKNKPSGFPLLTKKLTHTYMQWIRFHYYMAKLTGEQGYLNEAIQMAKVMDQQVTETNTPLGAAAQWTHGVSVLGENSMGPQRFNYARYTVHAAADLALEGFDVFGKSGFMEKMANMLAYFLMDSGAPESFAYLIDGTSSPRQTGGIYASSPYAQLGRWDSTGEILNVSEENCRLIESNPEVPTYIHIPAGMILSLLK